MTTNEKIEILEKFCEIDPYVLKRMAVHYPKTAEAISILSKNNPRSYIKLVYKVVNDVTVENFRHVMRDALRKECDAISDQLNSDHTEYSKYDFSFNVSPFEKTMCKVQNNLNKLITGSIAPWIDDTNKIRSYGDCGYNNKCPIIFVCIIHHDSINPSFYADDDAICNKIYSYASQQARNMHFNGMFSNPASCMLEISNMLKRSNIYAQGNTLPGELFDNPEVNIVDLHHRLCTLRYYYDAIILTTNAGFHQNALSKIAEHYYGEKNLYGVDSGDWLDYTGYNQYTKAQRALIEKHVPAIVIAIGRGECTSDEAYEYGTCLILNCSCKNINDVMTHMALDRTEYLDAPEYMTYDAMYSYIESNDDFVVYDEFDVNEILNRINKAMENEKVYKERIGISTN